jgi:hypothetical protein
MEATRVSTLCGVVIFFDRKFVLVMWRIDIKARGAIQIVLIRGLVPSRFAILRQKLFIL